MQFAESQNYLGQLVSVPSQAPYYHLSNVHAGEIKKAIEGQGGIRGRRVEVLVTSGNKLKIEAAKEAIIDWIQNLFNEMSENLHVQGYAVSSEIDEQPHSQDQTFIGANNRLKNLKVEMLKTSISQQTGDGSLRVLVSFENGIMLESIDQLKNPAIFQTESGAVWVDRCIVVGEIWFQGKAWNFNAISEGVTNPKAEVEESQKTNWVQTVGSFLSKKYGWPAADFHGDLAGKGRKRLMNETGKAGLGLQAIFTNSSSL